METPMSYVYAPRDASQAGTKKPGKPASDKQIALITKLGAEKDLTDIGGYFGGQVVGVPLGLALTSVQASNLISALFQCPKLPAKHEDGEAVSEGYYFVEGLIYKVQPAKSHGGLYAKVFSESGYEYAPGAMRLMPSAQRLTLEQAAEAGVKTGRCVVCARLLTDPESVAAGIGPICAGRL
jgi:hypothetical protein